MTSGNKSGGGGGGGTSLKRTQKSDLRSDLKEIDSKLQKAAARETAQSVRDETRSLAPTHVKDTVAALMKEVGADPSRDTELRIVDTIDQSLWGGKIVATAYADHKTVVIPKSTAEAIHKLDTVSNEDLRKVDRADLTHSSKVGGLTVDEIMARAARGEDLTDKNTPARERAALIANGLGALHTYAHEHTHTQVPRQVAYSTVRGYQGLEEARAEIMGVRVIRQYLKERGVPAAKVKEMTPYNVFSGYLGFVHVFKGWARRAGTTPERLATALSNRAHSNKMLDMVVSRISAREKWSAKTYGARRAKMQREMHNAGTEGSRSLVESRLID